MSKAKKTEVKRPEAGYRLERLYVSNQLYQLVNSDKLPSGNPQDRNVNFGWDWRPLGPRRFEIVLGLTCEPTTEAPEEVDVRLVGVFEADEGVPSVSLVPFIKGNGPAILFPYIREVVSTMTGRGLHGAFHIRPINVAVVAEQFDFAATTGAKYLAENPDFAKTFGLTVELPE